MQPASGQPPLNTPPRRGKPGCVFPLLLAALLALPAVDASPTPGATLPVLADDPAIEGALGFMATLTHLCDGAGNYGQCMMNEAAWRAISVSSVGKDPAHWPDDSHSA